jgi:hypothetical protein
MAKCTECNDTGTYIIKNAYDPSFEKVIDCEYCAKGSKKIRKLKNSDSKIN